MSRKRANGEGSIFKERSGRYRISISVKEGGKRKRKTKTAWKQADAIAILDELRGQAKSNINLRSHALTLEDYIKSWLSTVVTVASGNFAENTVKSYTNAMENHVIPWIGSKRLRTVSGVEFTAWLSDLADDEVGLRSRQNAYKVLHASLEHARETLKLISENTLTAVQCPNYKADECEPFSIDEAKNIMREAAKGRDHALIVTAMTSGMRGGELWGAYPDDINFRKRTLHVQRQAIENGGPIKLEKPKTESSIRKVILIPSTLAVLRDHISKLPPDTDMLFPSPSGGIESRANFRQRVWLPLLRKLGIRERGFHHARHTYATVALGAGVDIVTVSKNLGHSKTSITLDIYGHAMPEHNDTAASILSSVFG